MKIANHLENDAKRWNNPTLQPNLTNIITINGISYPITSPSDGIALSFDTETLYYCDISRTSLWSIPTKVLQDFQNDDNFIAYIKPAQLFTSLGNM